MIKYELSVFAEKISFFHLYSVMPSLTHFFCHLTVTDTRHRIRTFGVLSTVEPDIVTSPLSGVYNESTTVSLFCNATGNPSPNITWTKTGDSLFTYTRDTLTLTNVWRNNTGTYVCRASNGVGNVDTRNASVVVQCK